MFSNNAVYSLRHKVASLRALSLRQYAVGIDHTPEDLAKAMRAEKINRGLIYTDPKTKQVKASHTLFQPFAEMLQQDKRDYLGHEAVFLQVCPQTNILMGAFVHKTVRGQSAGGVRLWNYARMEDYIRDGLRLSVGMCRKNALAGLWWGGGKAVIARSPQLDELWLRRDFRDAVFQEFGRFMTSLRGIYVTAEDAGVTVSDVTQVYHSTRFTTCIPPELGGSGNPSHPTAIGVVCAMEGALDHLGLASLEGKTVALQGLGNVSTFMAEELLKRGVKSIVAAEINASRIDYVKQRITDPRLTIRHIKEGDQSILFENVDIVAPNALGGTLNPNTISNIKAKIICGAANNQLLDDKRDAQAIKDKGLIYVPDFLANRMGIVTCADEQFGYVNNDPAKVRHFDREWENAVFVVTKKVLAHAKRENITTAAAANTLADQQAEIPHPIWGHRGSLILQSLIEDNWHLGN
eukprot:TRINITY_DN687_c0_g3_i1.p1 TRINITY_DN687_c0_g3~~TRINITY_DN687_c0_g3_i1.p1  ORF type:complete len:464 (+),score=114.96 TRINITY_DN687_c0_g3_i1:111-1502(+)